MESSANPVLWVLLGQRAGDNRQMLALAEATGLPFVAKPLRFNRLSALPGWLLPPSRASLKAESRALLAPPWPRVVIASGRRAVPAARWIRGRSGGTARLVQIGRPWAPLGWFDLVVTTPQYGLPPHPAVLRNLMPLGRDGDAPALPQDLTRRLLALPSPRIALLLGGDSRPFVLDADTARRLGEAASRQAAAAGGSLLVVTGPRSRGEVVAALQAVLDVPAHLSRWGDGEPGYAAALQLADRFLVTADSAAMLAEAAASGRPVEVLPLPERPDLRLRLVRALRRLLPSRLFAALVAAGLVTSLRDLTGYAGELRAAGLLEGSGAAAERRDGELAAAAERVRRLAGFAEAPVSR